MAKETIVNHNGRTVTYPQFMEAFIDYCDDGEHSYDGGSIAFTWEEFVQNAIREDEDGISERDVWFKAFGWTVKKL